ncbi:MAG TPA: T9SS type A sorting domain-containing protein, partial [Bacteroidia bacterium]
ATDADGDSLVYELMAPPGTQNYVLPYNNFYFGCDSITGKISWDQPDSVGSFCFDVRIVEYRRISNQYYIVGQTMRDVYANVFLATSVNEAESGRPSFVVSPLPSGDKVNITFVEGTVFDRNSLQVFDVEGNKIEVKYTIQRSTFVIESNGLSPGLYMFLLNTDRSATVRGRFMIIE